MDDNIGNLCRTCFTKDSNLFSVFDIYNDNLTFDFIIKDVTGILITADDNYLPTDICEKCKEKAICAFEFRKSAINTDVEIRKFVETKDKIKLLKQQDEFEIKIEENNSFNSFLDVSFDSPDCLNDDLDNVKLEESGSSSFQCTKCQIVLGSVEEINNHFLSNVCDKGPIEETNSLCCAVCGYFYDTPELLNKHLQEHSTGYKKKLRPKKPLIESEVDKVDKESNNGLFKKPLTLTNYKCSFCKQCFVNKVTMKSHLHEHKGIKIVFCSVCKKMYLRREDFDKHQCLMEKSSCVENEIIPGELARSIICKEILLENILHNDSVEGNQDIIQVCTICSCILLSEEDLVNHVDMEHPECSQRCSQCKKVFASTKTAARHRKNCKQLEKKHICTTCGEKFAYEISLNKHILRNHEGQSVSVKFMDSKSRLQDRQYQCDTCSKSFYRKDLLVKHTKIHMPNEKSFECDVCKKRFHRRDNLRSHKRVHEFQRDKTNTSNCLCLYCGRSFSNSSNLIVHMRRHTGEKPYKCDFCGKGFPRSSDLKWHRRSHTGEKPCVCRICNKRFSRSNKLTRHMRVHTGHKPYKCTYCDKAFSQSYDLTLHIRRHTGDKPYICEVCGDRFIQGNALHNHRRVHGHFPPSETAMAAQQDLEVSFAVVQTIIQ